MHRGRPPNEINIAKPSSNTRTSRTSRATPSRALSMAMNIIGSNKMEISYLRQVCGRRAMLIGLIFAISLSVACGSDDKNDDFDTVDVTDNSDVDEVPEVVLPEGVAVPIDLVEHLADAPAAAAGSMKVFQLKEGDALPTSEVAEARAGDWVLENDRVKLYVEGVKREMSPCTYGGNIIDAQVEGQDGALSEDNVGEVCLMVNVGQTFAPERFDVVLDGARSEERRVG